MIFSSKDGVSIFKDADGWEIAAKMRVMAADSSLCKRIVVTCCNRGMVYVCLAIAGLGEKVTEIRFDRCNLKDKGSMAGLLEGSSKIQGVDIVNCSLGFESYAEFMNQLQSNNTVTSLIMYVPFVDGGYVQNFLIPGMAKVLKSNATLQSVEVRGSVFTWGVFGVLVDALEVRATKGLRLLRLDFIACESAANESAKWGRMKAAVARCGGRLTPPDKAFEQNDMPFEEGEKDDMLFEEGEKPSGCCLRR